MKQYRRRPTGDFDCAALGELQVVLAATAHVLADTVHVRCNTACAALGTGHLGSR